MPAAAVIPAPIAYIKVVAVKKLVVELLVRGAFGFGRRKFHHPIANCVCHSVDSVGSNHFTLKKLECFRQAMARIH